MKRKVCLFQVFEGIVLRVPAFPVSTMTTSMSSESSFEVAISDNYFQNAILVASPSLFQTLQKFLSKDLTKPKDVKKLSITLYKYLSRMSLRCTPFGLFASCLFAKWGTSTQVVIPCKDLVINSQIDMEYLCSLSRHLMTYEDIKEQCSYRVNSTIYNVGEYYRYIKNHCSGNKITHTIEQCPITEILTSIVADNKNTCTFYEWCNIINNSFDIDITDAKKYINSLIAEQILVSNIQPTTVGDDYLFNIQKTITGTDFSHELKAIKKITNKLSTNNQAVENCHILSNLTDKLRTHQATGQNILHIDSYKTPYQNTVSSDVIELLNEAAVLLGKLFPYLPTNQNLQDFKQRFVARYDSQSLPILEVLDPSIGIGYLQKVENVHSQLIDGLRFPVRNNKIPSLSLTPTNKLLLQKLLRCGEYAPCIEIFDSDVDNIETSFNDLPHTMAAIFRYLYNEDTCQSAICDLSFSGPSAANLLGRFAHGQKDINSLIKSITTYEQEQEPTKILAEIVHAPNDRSINILYRPHIRSAELSLISSTDIAFDKYIPISDINMSIKNNRILLHSNSLGKEIIPRLTTAHNFKQSNLNQIYRFLCDLQHQYGRPSLNFSWGSIAQAFNYLPRVVYKGIILSRAQWQISSQDIKKMNIDDKASIKSFRDKFHLPHHVNLVFADQKLYVDFDNNLSLNAMLSIIKNMKIVNFEEFIPCGNFITDELGNEYMNECIVPLKRLNDAN